MDQRLQFLSGYQKEEMSVADLCRAYGISRPTACRWINRYNEAGPEGLVDRSSRPHSCSHATLEPIENTILVHRAKHPSWRARKLKARLEMLQPDVAWPAASTFGNILSRAGLTSPQKKRKRTTPCSEPFSLVTGPNQLWCMDFKGYFATGDGKRYDPFTITDAYSRYGPTVRALAAPNEMPAGCDRLSSKWENILSEQLLYIRGQEQVFPPAPLSGPVGPTSAMVDCHASTTWPYIRPLSVLA